MSAGDYSLRCPACNAIAAVDCWAGNAHVYLRWLLDVPFGIMRHVLRYLGLFRSLAFCRTCWRLIYWWNWCRQ